MTRRHGYFRPVPDAACGLYLVSIWLILAVLCFTDLMCTCSGILLYAAIAAVLLYLRGHVATISNDSRRQVLVLFLTFSALWALVDFVNFAVPATSPMGCQVTIIASTLFDQAARVTIGGFLLWSVGHAKKTVVETYGLGTLMGIRIVIGGIFVAFVRPQFAPVCVAQMDMPAVSVVVMVLDMIVIGVLVIRLFTLGLFDAIREVHSSTKQEQSKALVYCVTGFCLWTLVRLGSYFTDFLPGTIFLHSS